MQDFKKILEAYGVNYDVTMERFLGNEAMYCKILNMLFEDENMDKLNAALTAGDVGVAFEAAHTLKGVTANMGLTHLHEALCNLVEPLRGGTAMETYPSLFETIREEFQKVRRMSQELNSAK